MSESEILWPLENVSVSVLRVWLEEGVEADGQGLGGESLQGGQRSGLFYPHSFSSVLGRPAPASPSVSSVFQVQMSHSVFRLKAQKGQDLTFNCCEALKRTSRPRQM